MKEITDLTDFLNMFTSVIPEGEYEFDGNKLVLTKTDNGFELKIQSIEEDFEAFDDTQIKQVVSDFKKNIDKIDDSMFIESLKLFKEVADIKKFNNLLDKEEFNEEEAVEIKKMINKYAQVIKDLIDMKIDNLADLRYRF